MIKSQFSIALDEYVEAAINHYLTVRGYQSIKPRDVFAARATVEKLYNDIKLERDQLASAIRGGIDIGEDS